MLSYLTNEFIKTNFQFNSVGQILFIQKIKELLNNNSGVSYSYKINNAYSILLELKSVIKDLEYGRTNGFILEEVRKEANEIVKKDLVMPAKQNALYGTVCDEIKKSDDVFLSVSTTSRDQRAGEIDGVTYNYTTEKHFEELIENGEMLEWAKYNENYYGTPKSTIEGMLSEGKSVVLEIEVQGALQVKKLIPECVLIFVVPPSMQILKERLLSRGRETEEQIAQRIKTAEWELTRAEYYNYIVVNDNLSECVLEIKDIMEKTKKSRALIDKLLSQNVLN